MKRFSIIFLQIVTVVIGIGAMAILLWEPQIEGRNAHANNFEIYFKDPFLAFVYFAIIPFFMALYQAFKLLRYISQNKTFSSEAIQTLKLIRNYTLTVIGFVFIAEIIILLNTGEDRAGGVFIGMLIAGFMLTIATSATVLEHILLSSMGNTKY